MISDTMYWCETAWHDGRKTPADFFILAQTHERNREPHSFACCEYHLVDAMKIMLDQHKNVTVRKVNRPSNQPPGKV